MQKSESKLGKDRPSDESSGPARPSDESSGPAPLFFGYSPFALWRFAFYVIMAYNWKSTYFGPCAGWDDAMTYDHAEWVYDFAPKTLEAAERLRWFGTAAALVSIFNDNATIVFAILSGSKVFSNITMFINHYYLFFLLSTLMAVYCNCGKDNIHDKAGLIHALRGQVVVVYAFASLWKFDSDWLSGHIVKQIFLSFEEQGDHRGIPWSKIYAAYPDIFLFIGISGLFLDFMLFVVLMFLRPGNKLQAVGLLFHGFTAYTMAERIGYSFPLTMISAGLLFQKSDAIEKDQKSLGGDILSHAKWLSLQMRLRPSHSGTKRIQQGFKKRHLLPLLFLIGQWLIPLRMPLVSRGEFKHTFEGYRWSWTMMLHSKQNMKSPGMTFMTLRPFCGAAPYPNHLAQRNPLLDIHSFPWEESILQRVRTLSVIQMFPRQMPKVAHLAKTLLGDDSCTHPGGLRITTSYFSSTNQGPYHRIIDPTSDLFEVHRAHTNLPWPTKLWYAIVDKATPGQEFVLRGTGSADIPLGPKDAHDELTLVDRSPCLQADPIRIHNNNFEIEFDSNSEIEFRLLLRGCPELNVQNCKEIYLNKGEKVRVPAIRTLTIGIDTRKDLGKSCSESRKEDVVIKLTNIALPN